MDIPTSGKKTTADVETKRMCCPRCGIEATQQSTPRAFTWLCSACGQDWVDLEALKTAMA